MARPPFKPNPGKSYGKPPFKGGFKDRPRPKPVLTEAERKLTYDPENDLIYGVHPVVEALKNPKRKFVKLWASENAAARLREDIPELPVEPETVHPRLLDHMLKSADAVHQGVILDPWSAFHSTGNVHRKWIHFFHRVRDVFRRQTAGEENRFAEFFCFDCQIPIEFFAGAAEAALGISIEQERVGLKIRQCCQ